MAMFAANPSLSPRAAAIGSPRYNSGALEVGALGASLSPRAVGSPGYAAGLAAAAGAAAADAAHAAALSPQRAYVHAFANPATVAAANATAASNAAAAKAAVHAGAGAGAFARNHAVASVCAVDSAVRGSPRVVGLGSPTGASLAARASLSPRVFF